MSKHTPEPWVKKGSTVISPSRGGLTVEEYDEQTWTYYGGHLIAESITDANALRIVACVNACAGIPSEALEAGVIGKMAESLKTSNLCMDSAAQALCKHGVRGFMAIDLEVQAKKSADVLAQLGGDHG